MPIKMPRSDEVAAIPQAKIELKDFLQFNGDCIDPLALTVIVEALDYAMGVSVRRLRSAGKIWPQVEQTAYGTKTGLLPFIRGVREAILDIPTCKGEVKIPLPMEPIESFARLAEKEAKKKPAPAKKAKTEVLIALTPEEEAGLQALPAGQREGVRQSILKTRAELAGIQQTEPKTKSKKPDYSKPYVRVMRTDGSIFWQDAEGKNLPKEMWPK